jgi:hypothetical protein
MIVIALLARRYLEIFKRKREYLRLWRRNNPELVKIQNRRCNKEKRRASWKNWSSKNKAKVYASLAKWQAKNPDKVKQYQAITIARRAANPERVEELYKKKAAYYQKNKKHIIAKVYEWQKKKSASDPVYRMKTSLRSRFSRFLRRKNNSFWEITGCTGDELKSHLESKFVAGMNWSNYGMGREKWSVDHIIPCVKFDHSDPDQIKKCHHFSNLQPLWNPDNFRKNKRIYSELKIA